MKGRMCPCGKWRFPDRVRATVRAPAGARPFNDPVEVRVTVRCPKCGHARFGTGLLEGSNS